MTPLRLFVPLLLTLLVVAFVAYLMRRRGLEPPRLRLPEGGVIEPRAALEVALRRALVYTAMTVVFYLAVLAPLGAIGLDTEPDLEALGFLDLFSLHALFALVLIVWYVLGFLPHGAVRTSAAVQLGLRTPSIGRELLVGTAAGVGIWLVVLVLLLFLSALVALFGGADALPQEPPGMVIWIAGLPFWMKIAVSLSAGFFEEVFFRGFLQSRVGVGLSTVFFALAHLSYDQPFMLVGVTMLSLLFSWLVVWRQSIWAAVVAHAFFDLTQLLVVIPGVLWLQDRAPQLAAGLLVHIA